MKRILVTGCSGFIGAATAKLLMSQGHETTGVDDMSGSDGTRTGLLGMRHVLPGLSAYIPEMGIVNRSTMIVCDFTDRVILDKISNRQFDAVIHCAANPSVPMSIDKPIETFENNVFKTQALAYTCAKAKTRLVFASSSAVYGDVKLFPTIEEERCYPLSPYGLQKLHCEELIKMYAQLYDLDAYCLRYFNVYGPGQDGSSAYCTLIARWCERIKAGLPLLVEGDGTRTRDLVYIDDVAMANVIAATMEAKKPTMVMGFGNTLLIQRRINICSGEEQSVNSILEKFRLQRPEIQVEYVPARIGDAERTLGSPDYALGILGIKTMTSFDDGMKEVFKHWGI